MPGRQPDVISLSPLGCDPVASMRMWGADVTFGDRVFHVPAMDAAGWLELLLAENIAYEALFPGLAGPQAVFEVNEMLLSEQADPAELERAIFDLIETVSGRPWWVTVRLCYSARRNWEAVGGQLACAGVSPWGTPLGYWLDALYTTMIDLFMKGPEPKRASTWSQALTQLPPSENRQVDDVANTDAFLAALRAAQ